MEFVADRRPTWRVFLVPIIAATLLFGWLAYASGRGDVPAPSVPKISADDLLLAVAKGKGTISLAYTGVTAPPGPVHTDHAPMNSFQWGVGRGISSPTSGGGPREASTPSVSEITMTHMADKYSAGFLKESLVGVDSTAVIYFSNVTVGTTTVDSIEMRLDNTMISGFSMSSGGDLPSESLSLNFTKFTLRAQLGGTDTTVTYNIATGALE
jgi:type VI secretion system secreted protein Hcp